jgi:hypothetical protein
MLTRVRRSFSGCTGPPEAVPSLLIIPHSSHVYPVLCNWSHMLRDNCEPSYVHRHDRPTSSTAHDAWSTWQNSSRSSSIHSSSSMNSLVTGIWRDVTDTVCQAPCHTRPVMPLHVAAPSPLISVFPTPRAPLGLSSPTSYSGFLNLPIVLLVLPFPRILQRWNVSLHPAPFCTQRPSAAASDERTGNNRGRYQSVPNSFTPSYNGVPSILCPISLRTLHISEELYKRYGRTLFENAKRAAESRMNR